MASRFIKSLALAARLEWSPTAVTGLVGGALAALHIAGCDVEAGLQKVGIRDPAPAPPIVEDLVCDFSVDSTCTLERLTQTLDAILARVATRTGSRVRLWTLGATVESSALAAEIVAPAFSSRTTKARNSESTRWQAHARDVFMARAASLVSSKHAPTRSPLAEMIAAVALADGQGCDREIVVITDARETALADFECGTLPTDAAWSQRLRDLHVLTPGLLSGVNVVFAHVTTPLPPVSRCRAGVDREQRIRQLWKSSLAAAGAHEVRILSGPIAWDERPGRRNGGPHEIR